MIFYHHNKHLSLITTKIKLTNQHQYFVLCYIHLIQINCINFINTVRFVILNCVILKCWLLVESLHRYRWTYLLIYFSHYLVLNYCFHSIYVYHSLHSHRPECKSPFQIFFDVYFVVNNPFAIQWRYYRYVCCVLSDLYLRQANTCCYYKSHPHCYYY